MTMPDITPAQIVAGVGWIAAQAVGQGWITDGTQQTILAVASTFVFAAWTIADSIIRHGRAKIAAAAIEAPGDTKAELAKVSGTK